MNNAETIKGLKTAAAAAALNPLVPAGFRAALAALVDLVEQFDARLRALEQEKTKCS